MSKINYLDKHILNIIFEYLTHKETTKLKIINKYIYHNIIINHKYKISKLLSNNYYTDTINNSILNNNIDNKYISNSEIIEKLHNKSYSFIIGNSVSNKDSVDIYLFYYDKYLYEYKFKYMFSKNIYYLNHLELIYFGGEIFIMDNFTIRTYNLLSEKMKDYKINENCTEIKTNIKCTILKNKMLTMQSYWSGMSNPSYYYQYPIHEIFVWKSNIKRERYGNESKLIKSRRFYGITTFNNKIWVAGGIDNSNEYLNSVEIYDPNIEKWNIDESPMINKRHNCKLSVIKNNIYAIGGDININKLSIEKYDGKWKLVTEIQCSQENYHTLILDSRLFLFYNEICTDYISYYPDKIICKIYDFESNIWYDYNMDQLFPYNDVNIYSVNIEI
jgi:hypothetical protein